MHKVRKFSIGISAKFYFFEFLLFLFFRIFLSKFWTRTNILLTGTLGTTAFPSFDQTTSGFIVDPVTTVAFVTTAPSPGKVSSCDTRDWYHKSNDMWLVKMGVNHYARRGLLFFKCAMSHGHFACFYFYVRTDIRTAVILFCLLKIAEKQYFFILKFCFFFQTATDSNHVTSQVSVSQFLLWKDFDWLLVAKLTFQTIRLEVMKSHRHLKSCIWISKRFSHHKIFSICENINDTILFLIIL